ncbi:MAG: hypothetical protein Q9222_006901 [Ikaeria aurantiellina]
MYWQRVRLVYTNEETYLTRLLDNVSAFAAQLRSQQVPLGESSSNGQNTRIKTDVNPRDQPPEKKPKIDQAAAIIKPVVAQWQKKKKKKKSKKKKPDRNKHQTQNLPAVQQFPADAFASVQNAAPNLKAILKAEHIPSPPRVRKSSRLSGLQASNPSNHILNTFERPEIRPDPNPISSAVQIEVQPSASPSQSRELSRAVPPDPFQRDASQVGEQSGDIALSRGVSIQDVSEVQQLSTFIPSKNNVISHVPAECTLNLGGNTLTLIGQYEIWIQKGAVSLMGAVLYPSSTAYAVHAPSVHSLPPIKPIKNPFASSSQEVIVTISNFNNGIRALKHVSPNFGRIWNKADEHPGEQLRAFGESTQRTFTFLGLSSDDTHKRPLRLLEPPSDWQALISTVLCTKSADQPKQILVCGPKGSGKSTFTRMLINALLTKSGNEHKNNRHIKLFNSVALLDMDPGQPEYSPPGEISLVQVGSCSFGPPFCHPTADVDGLKFAFRSHHTGASSPRDDPDHYLQCIIDLLQCYKQILKYQPDLPLVMNAPGWIQGKGLELLTEIIHHSNPSDVVYLSTLGPLEVVESISLAAGLQTALHLVTSQPVEHAPRSAAVLRMMQTLSYFHLGKSERNNVRWNATPINEMPTISVQYAGPNQSMFAVQLLGPELDPEFLLDALEASVVGLVVIEDDAAMLPATGLLQASSSSGLETDTHSGVGETSTPKHASPTIDPVSSKKSILADLHNFPEDPGHPKIILPQELESPADAGPSSIVDADEISYMKVDTDPDMLQTPRPSATFGSSLFSRYRGQEPSTPADFDDTTLQFLTPASHLSASTPHSPPEHPATRLPYTSPATTESANYSFHPQPPRNPEQIPYLPSINGVTPPLLPSHSHSIGQAIIHSIDTKNHILHLITPISLTTFNTLHKQGRKIVLVKGSLDVPTWAYKEDLHMEMRRRKCMVKSQKKVAVENKEAQEAGVKGWEEGDTKEWAEGKPWVSGEGRGKGEKIRRVRRDLGRKSKG